MNRLRIDFLLNEACLDEEPEQLPPSPGANHSNATSPSPSPSPSSLWGNCEEAAFPRPPMSSPSTSPSPDQQPGKPKPKPKQRDRQPPRQPQGEPQQHNNKRDASASNDSRSRSRSIATSSSSPSSSSSSSSSSSAGTGAGRRRWASAAQREVLEAAFLADPLPSSERKAALAGEVGMSHKSVHLWFQNKRARNKKKSSVRPPVPKKRRIRFYDCSHQLEALHLLQHQHQQQQDDLDGSKQEDDEVDQEEEEHILIHKRNHEQQDPPRSNSNCNSLHNPHSSSSHRHFITSPIIPNMTPELVEGANSHHNHQSTCSTTTRRTEATVVAHQHEHQKHLRSIGFFERENTILRSAEGLGW